MTQAIRCTADPAWAPLPRGGYDRVVRTIRAFRYVIVPPLTYVSPPRPIAEIEAEIRRATIPGMRAEDI